jgi:hypothetical protein
MKPKAGSEFLILRIRPFSTAIRSTSFVNNKIRHELMRDRGSSVSIVSGYGLDDRAIEVRSPDRDKRIFPLVSVCRPALGPTQPPVQWVPGVPSPGLKRSRGVTLTTHPHLVPRPRMSGSYISSPPKRLCSL